MLDKELDKLRDKTLSFWCKIIDKTHSFFWKSVPEEMIIVSKSMEFYETDWVYLLHYRWNPTVNFPIEDILDGEKCEIIWHPLTRWRIEHYYKNNGTDYKYTQIYIKIRTRFENSREKAYNQSELERMQHEKRPELKELLIQFSNYL